MNSIRRAAPIAQFLLLLPAALFMLSLILRGMGPMQYEPAHTAQQIVLWYSGRIWTLWLLLTLLPLAVLGIGGTVLLGQSSTEPHRLLGAILSNGTTMLVAVLTPASAIILLIVGVHVLRN